MNHREFCQFSYNSLKLFLTESELKDHSQKKNSRKISLKVPDLFFEEKILSESVVSLF